MPGYDRTGPIGDGAMSGRGRGLCRSDQRDQAPAGSSRIVGKGRGGGFGLRGGMRGRVDRQAGLRDLGQRMDVAGENLESQVDELRKSLTAIEQRLARVNQKDG